MAKKQKAFNPFAPSTSKKSEAPILNDEHDETQLEQISTVSYKNVVAVSPMALDKAVNIEIQAGWRPMGNMTTYHEEQQRNRSYSQTMVKGIVVEVLSFPPEGAMDD
jgi:hypothetical protein